ncbi:MAG: aminoacyl-tRNA hydrolase [Gammaproteobacteria bacterium]|jgi:PTH1 family peptidyl-tRNA hydrolase|nr:aminoacyl-tRNA hydrolase [Gammaproteobacteria bacterium]MBT6042954.1 aminoacyl-tRNA hydrolase [Gammaproteobacteria bacterium]
MNDGIKLIVGLGNPGQQYRFTRHNAGAMFLETLCDDFHGELRPDSKFFGLAERISIAGHDVRLLFPTTYMNNSGQAVSAMARYYDIAPENILVAYDELDLPVETIRLKSGGGHGGHNGVRDIAKALDSNEFYRLRIGIGRPTGKGIDYVLGVPSKQEADAIQNNIDEAIRLLPLLVEGKFQEAMGKLHTKEDNL